MLRFSHFLGWNIIIFTWSFLLLQFEEEFSSNVDYQDLETYKQSSFPLSCPQSNFSRVGWSSPFWFYPLQMLLLFTWFSIVSLARRPAWIGCPRACSSTWFSWSTWRRSTPTTQCSMRSGTASLCWLHRSKEGWVLVQLHSWRKQQTNKQNTQHQQQQR